jgi:hypothetical protein
VCFGAATQEELKAALDAAEHHLLASDQCESCRYNLACVIARKAENLEGAEREQLVRSATEHYGIPLKRVRFTRLNGDDRGS